MTGLNLAGPERRVEPEWLDELPANDPRAVSSRRDLQLMNRIMGHAAIIRRVLERGLTSQPRRIVDIGAGDGTLLLRALPKRIEATRAQLVFLDRQPVVSAETVAAYAARGYSVSIEQTDVFEWLARETSACDAMIANLFLHHFKPPALAKLLSLAAARTPLFVACEPRRAWLPLHGSRMLGLIGCNDVTRHDAHLSVRAGFTADELSQLWPHGPAWNLEERKAGMFSHLFVSSKR